ncbi:hypothetical protein ACFFQW_40305 [Umezawaea endophytica]|uniref:Uncharacterized protein n=1 Tax=Umezawaea endophytica TaxID=1654476 RepID=A0A9X2VXL6_9PSEU|nr:hypothetical protein [Umezawaea endophytica]MCS7484481.1 hypothetical protein [Umezawaea endophytica]
MNTSSPDGYWAIATALTPPAVSQYLAAHDWELESKHPNVREIWRLVGERGPMGRIMLPLATDFVDFSQRFLDALHALGRIYDWDPSQLAERIMAARADLFFVRLDQAMTDGTIPFRQAEKTMDALFKMMKAAATTAADPAHPHRGRRPSSVTDFLDDDVRLGHTKTGSFVFTVVTRLGDPLPPLDDGSAAVSFPRRVMETLATGLETTRDLARRWDSGTADQAGHLGLSAGLVESLQDLTQPEALRSLDLSFDWASSEPRPSVGRTPIVVDRDVIAALPRVRERLVRQEEPPRTETLVGTVRALTREDPGGQDLETATIVLATYVRGRARSVHITLNGEDHEWAILAYHRKLPFTVTGDLVFERGAWRLTGVVTVDSSFLEHRGP